jgi:hypothetical protein
MNWQKQNWRSLEEIVQAIEAPPHDTNALHTLRWVADRYIKNRIKPMELTKVTAKDFLKATQHWVNQ